MGALDMRALPAENKKAVGCVFPSATAHIFDDVGVRVFLLRATDALENAKAGGPRVALWSVALACAEGDPGRAVRWLAILFQDTDAFSHLRALRQVYPGAQDDIDRLERLCEAVRNSALVDPLPMSQPARTGCALYHFYVNAQATLALIDRGFDPSVAAAVVCVFNTTYELFRHRLISGLDRVPAPGIDNGIGLVRMLKGALATLFQIFWPTEPDRILLTQTPSNPDLYVDAQREHDDVLTDTYLGYAGPAFARRLADPNAMGAIGRAEFDARFATDPRAFLESLFVAPEQERV
ncbi:MAG: hypothetical protein IT381_23650 [Deltaproteobacteria bacterium]|nr:hypothetical protein [Deltaproteobacteria bacterium]